MLHHALERPLSTRIAAATLVAIGAFSLLRLPVSLLPEIQRPRLLLEALLIIEAAAGRERRQAGEARVLDLDLLLYDDVVLSEPHLSVPHPRLTQRAFVLRPLHDLDPAMVIPDAGPLAPLLARVTDQVLEPVAADWCPGMPA